MTIQEVAVKLDGRQYGGELNRQEADKLRDAGIVIVFGASDDLMEFRGAINEELDAYDGGIAYLTDKGIPRNKCDDDRCPYYLEKLKDCRTIDAVWCAPDSPPWTFETDVPHKTFDIYEDGEVFCRGIVFKLSEV